MVLTIKVINLCIEIENIIGHNFNDTHTNIESERDSETNAIIYTERQKTLLIQQFSSMQFENLLII